MPYLIALTSEGKEALPECPFPLNRLPLRIGRDLRRRKRFRLARERRRGRAQGSNDIYLPESGPTHRLSREHLAIDRDGGGFFVEDLHSACGTWVSDKPVGGNRRGGQCSLEDGDTIFLGGRHSPWAFRFHEEDLQPE